MVRLKTKVHKDYVTIFSKKFFETVPNVFYFENFSTLRYRHEWTIRDTTFLFDDKRMWEYSYYLGYRFGAEKPSDFYTMVLEYNPNKCLIEGLLLQIIKTFFNSDDVVVQSLDFAIDFNIDILNIVVDKWRKREYKYFKYSKADNDITHYIGKGDNRVKIYNKGLELGVDETMTRFEVTLCPRCKMFDIREFKCPALPNIYVISNSDGFDKSISPIIYALMMGYHFHDLTDYTQRHLRSILKEFNLQIEFDYSIINSTIYEYFETFSSLIKNNT